MSAEVTASKINRKGEIRANKYLIRCMVITFCFYTLCWILNVLHIFIVDGAIMTRGLVGMVFFLGAVLLASVTMGMESPKTKYVIMFLAVGMYSFVVMTLMYHVILISVFPLLCSVQYSKKSMTIYTYVLTLLGITFSTVFGFKYGLCDGNMLLLTSTTTANHIEMIRNGEFVLNDNLATIFLFFVFPRCLVTTAFVPILNRLCSDITEKAEQEAATKRRAEMDAMTGVYNKNKYLDKLANYYPKVEKVAVIFWDVNNLKAVNDEYGHEYGDQLIAVVSESISDLASDECRVYRIGGDEFVMIMENAKPGDAEWMVSIWKKNFEGQSIGDGIPVSAAVGYAEGDGANIEAVVKQADEAMYFNKKQIKAK